MCPFCIASAAAAIGAAVVTSAAAGGAAALIVRRFRTLRAPIVGVDAPVRRAEHGTTENRQQRCDAEEEVTP